MSSHSGEVRSLGEAVRLMERATEQSRTITVERLSGGHRPMPDPDEGHSGDLQDQCRDCETEVRTWTLANRTAYACETCQPVR